MAAVVTAVVARGGRRAAEDRAVGEDVARSDTLSCFPGTHHRDERVRAASARASYYLAEMESHNRYFSELRAIAFWTAYTIHNAAIVTRLISDYTRRN